MIAACDAGAEDVAETADLFEVYTEDASLQTVKQALETAHIPIENTARIMHPTLVVEGDTAHREKIEALVEVLEALDDVQTVFTNI